MHGGGDGKAARIGSRAAGAEEELESRYCLLIATIISTISLNVLVTKQEIHPDPA